MLGGERGGERPTKFSKRGVGRISIFRGRLLGRRGSPFSRGCSFYIKNKLKSETFDDKKKFINKNVFLCHN